ncbi:MAG: rod shape-determining protein RodA [Prevotellaceae bacterium]|jgi:rod shape determining protein RodA|nr:rod shape-determining protein RodA [Prevotellaceae bacterium]
MTMTDTTQNQMYKFDWLTVALYLLLVFIGWISIYASAYNEAHSSIVDPSQRYGMQMLWIASSIMLALIVLFTNQKFFSVFAYPIYGVVMLALVMVLFAGTEINGSRSWFTIGPFRLQPAELAKVATSLALARHFSQYHFKINNPVNILKTAAIIGLPVALILLQHDTGSACVFASLIIMLYREGLSGWVVLLALFSILLFILSIIWQPLSVLILIWALCLLIYALVSRRIFITVLAGMLSFGVFFLLTQKIFPHFGIPNPTPDRLLLLLCATTLLIGIVATLKKKLRYVWVITLFFIGSLAFESSVDYAFVHLLKPHQRARIEDMLGMQNDLQNVGYNVHQSKVAIGSGGAFGKGFLKGTQTRYNFVPEQSTDFIFCTIGEEWGFAGTVAVVFIYLLLLGRIVVIAERQRHPFFRIYGYCVLSVLAFHVLINIAMTIGLAPVIGIPLPYVSYGGSSLWAFTIMLAILLKADAMRWE